MKRHGRYASAACAFVAAGCAVLSACETTERAVDAAAGSAIARVEESAEAAAIAREMIAQAPSLGDADAVDVVMVARDRARVVPRNAAARSHVRAIDVELPIVASGSTSVVDRASGVGVSFAAEGHGDARLSVGRGLVVYPNGGPAGAHYVQRADARGVEDFVRFDRKPDVERRRYRVDVSRAAGLRLVSGSLEVLDENGTPRLRVARPYVIDARRRRRAATLRVEGCAFDDDPRAPWGRPVTPPGASACTVEVAWSLAADAYPAIVDPAWVSTRDMNGNRFEASGTLLAEGRVLVAGGTSETDDLDTAELFDAATGSWAATGRLLSLRHMQQAVRLNDGRVLVVGGLNGSGAAVTALDSTEIYDPATGTWVKPAGNPASTTDPRAWHTLTMLSDGRVVTVGSFVPPPQPAALATAEVFDPSTESWSVAGSMHFPRCSHTATALADGRLLVVGGTTDPNTDPAPIYDNAEVYDPVSDAWTDVAARMSVERQGHTATMLADGTILVAGGTSLSHSFPVRSAELFDPHTDTWQATGDLIDPRFFQKASLLVNGKVLLAGDASALARTELYDPEAHAFSSAGDMADPRWGHVQERLADGRVLVAGGLDATHVVAKAELFGTAFGEACTAGDATSCWNGFCVESRCCPSTDPCMANEPDAGGAGAGGQKPDAGGGGAGGQKPDAGGGGAGGHKPDAGNPEPDAGEPASPDAPPQEDTNFAACSMSRGPPTSTAVLSWLVALAAVAARRRRGRQHGALMSRRA